MNTSVLVAGVSLSQAQPYDVRDQAGLSTDDPFGFGFDGSHRHDDFADAILGP